MFKSEPLMHLQLPSVCGSSNRPVISIACVLFLPKKFKYSDRGQAYWGLKLNACVTQLADLVESSADSAVWDAGLQSLQEIGPQSTAALTRLTRTNNKEIQRQATVQLVALNPQGAAKFLSVTCRSSGRKDLVNFWRKVL